MAVYSDSRYVTGVLLDAEDTRTADATERDFLYTHEPISPDVEIDFVHTVVEGERLDQLAYRFSPSKNAKLWWVIADVNEIFGYPLRVAAGTKLKIPVAEVFRDAESGVR